MSSLQHSADTDSISRSPTFWCRDGNVILKTTDGTHFRVHRGVLSMDSVVFSNMFEDAVPSADEELDGCSVVMVHDDKSDLEVLLSSLYKPSIIHPFLPNMRADDLLTMLHMFRKYQYDGLLNRTLERLKLEFPTNFADFRQKYQPHFSHCNIIGKYEGKCGLMMCTRDVLLQVINYAVKFDIKSVLPVGYYLASMILNIEEVYDGWNGTNNTKMTFYKQAQRALVIGRTGMTGSIVSCFPSHPIDTVQGHRVLVTAESCLDPAKCHARQMNYFNKFIGRFLGEDNPFFFTCLFPKLVEPAAYTSGMIDLPCRDCFIKVWEIHHPMGTEEGAFDYLPYCFGLEDWESVLSS